MSDNAHTHDSIKPLPAQASSTTRADTKQKLEKEVKPLQQFFTKFLNDWSLNLSAALAYNLLLSTFPIIVALLSILGLLVGITGQSSTSTIAHTISSALPAVTHPEAIVNGVQENLAKSSGILGIIAVVSAIVVGSRLFVLLDLFFSIVYRVRPRTLIRQNIMAILMFIVFILMVPLISFASSIPSLAFSLLKDTPIGQLPFLAGAAGILGSLIASFILFEVIYVVVPNLNIRLRHGWLGALVAAIALQLYLTLFPLYTSHFLVGVVGAIGLAAVLLVFFYYFAVILFLGAEVNAFFSEGVKPLPNDLATFASTMGGKLNKDIPDDESASHIDTKPTDKADKEHAVDFVKETPDSDVPPSVAEDPKIQKEVLKQQSNNKPSKS